MVGQDNVERYGRAQWFRPAELDTAQRDLYNAIVSGPRARSAMHSPLQDDAGRLTGPFNALLYSPPVGDAVQRVGAAIRYESQLSDRVREIAVLVVAQSARCDTEWLLHIPLATQAGLTTDQLSAMRSGVVPEDLDELERTGYEVARALVAAEDLSDAQFETATDILGERLVMELVTLVGYYRLLAMSMRVWRTPLPTNQSAVFEEHGS